MASPDVPAAAPPASAGDGIAIRARGLTRHFGALVASGWQTASIWMRKLVDHRKREAEAPKGKSKKQKQQAKNAKNQKDKAEPIAEDESEEDETVGAAEDDGALNPDFEFGHERITAAPWNLPEPGCIPSCSEAPGTRHEARAHLSRGCRSPTEP